MAESSPNQITKLLAAWSDGEVAACEKLVPLVYAELHRLAHRYMRRERSDHTLQTSALVNEAYLRLVGTEKARWQNRAHFFAVSARLMRRILVDLARAKHNLKRGGGLQSEPTWSPDGRAIYFVSRRGTGFLNVWGIRFDQTKGESVGEPFQVTFYESPANGIWSEMGSMGIGLSADRLVLPLTQVTGSIWVLTEVHR